ncbi:hypothetical protein JCM9533A_09530 [Catenuloplanes niger JCM 9533]
MLPGCAAPRLDVAFLSRFLPPMLDSRRPGEVYMDDRTLGGFLRLRPEGVGLPGDGLCRIPALRRDEAGSPPDPRAGIGGVRRSTAVERIRQPAALSEPEGTTWVAGSSATGSVEQAVRLSVAARPAPSRDRRGKSRMGRVVISVGSPSVASGPADPLTVVAVRIDRAVGPDLPARRVRAGLRT